MLSVVGMDMVYRIFSPNINELLAYNFTVSIAYRTINAFADGLNDAAD